jgi:hypothetical protein
MVTAPPHSAAATAIASISNQSRPSGDLPAQIVTLFCSIFVLIVNKDSFPLRGGFTCVPVWPDALPGGTAIAPAANASPQSRPLGQRRAGGVATKVAKDHAGRHSRVDECRVPAPHAQREESPE